MLNYAVGRHLHWHAVLLAVMVNFVTFHGATPAWGCTVTASVAPLWYHKTLQLSPSPLPVKLSAVSTDVAVSRCSIHHAGIATSCQSSTTVTSQNDLSVRSHLSAGVALINLLLGQTNVQYQ